MKNYFSYPFAFAVAGLLVVFFCEDATAYPGRGGSCTLCHTESGGSLTATPNPLDVDLGSSSLLTFSVTNLGGSSSTAISVQGLENPALDASVAAAGDSWTYKTNSTYGMSYVSNTISSTGPYTLDLMVGPSATPGTYPIVVMFAGDGAMGTSTGFDVRAILAVAAADFNEDGKVDSADLVNWKGGYGISGTATHMQGDANADLNVDGKDFLLWQREVGSSLSLTFVAVPEPTSIVLYLIGCVVGINSRGVCNRRYWTS